MPNSKEHNPTPVSGRILDDHNVDAEIRALIRKQGEELMDLRVLLAQADERGAKMEKRIRKLEVYVCPGR